MTMDGFPSTLWQCSRKKGLSGGKVLQILSSTHLSGLVQTYFVVRLMPDERRKGQSPPTKSWNGGH